MLFRVPRLDPLLIWYTLHILNHYQSITDNSIFEYADDTTILVPQFLLKKNFKICNGGLTPTSFKSIFPKLKNLYLDFHLHVILLHHNPPVC